VNLIGISKKDIAVLEKFFYQERKMDVEISFREDNICCVQFTLRKDAEAIISEAFKKELNGPLVFICFCCFLSFFFFFFFINKEKCES
jgi:hypothetical protein